ncbi:3-hydroxyacyl-CoA dehydrogenase NAD-binding domain-containing protein [Bacillus sp. V33-4]|uniref:3-hydroxyacyl-CoA dehydrogenase NAD-binding domain-containing protein n=1 Tax=Bacillus sp. V33-4 TaxID=2054169 RepID=UPI000C75FB6A|nr:3-hydroxyacyl-CoA dehydrogenase NAD-binding domain-containing protein [Bacillus sp. V33-4]PLR81233.1 3-hydroxybutyryl-CoA dehydrogenase [Bacillus sp. V33-4]
MEEIKTVGIVGSGTMGAGIAQLIAQSGFTGILFDIDEETVKRAKTSIESGLDRLAEKKKASIEEIQQAKGRLHTTSNLQDFKDCQLVIEAVPEKIDIKRSIFQQLEEICSPDTILSTNTSSLSITEISGLIQNPKRVAGCHFFNPAPVMPLVEVIQGLKTSQETIEALVDFAKKLSKSPVVCKDTPGFIVNRVARPFYNEAIRIMNDHVATVEQIDRIMKQAGKFKMGPFELQDLIGIDINFATTKSVYSSFHGESRFRPHYYQERMVQSGSLGRKTKGGFFSYDSN